MIFFLTELIYFQFRERRLRARCEKRFAKRFGCERFVLGYNDC
jgi:hypothetical protein